MNLSIGDPVGCGDGHRCRVAGRRRGGRRRDRRGGRRGQRRPANCTVKSPGAAGVGADGRRDGRHGRRRVLASLLLEPRPDRRRPDQARRLRARASTCRWPCPAAGYVANSGTSVAAPFTTGTALLMLQANPDAHAGPDQADDHEHRGRLGPAGQGQRVRRRTPRRLRGAARRRRAACRAPGGARPPHVERHACRGSGRHERHRDRRPPFPAGGDDARAGQWLRPLAARRRRRERRDDDDPVWAVAAGGHHAQRARAGPLHRARRGARRRRRLRRRRLGGARSGGCGSARPDARELPAATNDDTPVAAGYRRHRARRFPGGRGARAARRAGRAAARRHAAARPVVDRRHARARAGRLHGRHRAGRQRRQRHTPLRGVRAWTQRRRPRR